MKTALVTGSAGFAGRHFAEALMARGYSVTGIDKADGDDALDYFATYRNRSDLVIHCAAVVGGRATIDGDPLAQAINLQLDAAMFRWAVRTKPGRVVYISSSAAYPVAEQRLMNHTKLIEAMIDPALTGQVAGIPDQLYGWAKLTGENLAHRARQAGLKVSVIRPFSGYGEDQDPSYPFRAFAERAKRRADPFEIWGNPFQCRDFIHIDDITEATLVMCEQGIDGPVNLGTGIPTTMEHLACLFTRAAGYVPKLDLRKDAPMGVEYRVADVGRMSEFYLPKISLEEGVRRALAYGCMT
jgi:UDP-glucose 4-epimerase